MTKIVPLNQSPQEILLGHINYTNDSFLKPSDVVFGPPLELINNPEFNTAVKLTAPEGHLVYTGDQTVSYNRLDLNRLFDGALAVVTGHIHDHITAVDLMNVRFGMQLSPDSVYAAEIDASGEVSVRITNHLVYLPNTTVKVIDEFDFNLRKLRKLIHNDLFDAMLPA